MKIKLKKIEKRKNEDKDWRDAFVEFDIIDEEMKVKHACADSIRIDVCNKCNKYRDLCAYVGQFENGGFWFSEKGLHFITSGTYSDKEATYEDAVRFLEERR